MVYAAFRDIRKQEGFSQISGCLSASEISSEQHPAFKNDLLNRQI